MAVANLIDDGIGVRHDLTHWTVTGNDANRTATVDSQVPYEGGAAVEVIKLNAAATGSTIQLKLATTISDLPYGSRLEISFKYRIDTTLVGTGLTVFLISGNIVEVLGEYQVQPVSCDNYKNETDIPDAHNGWESVSQTLYSPTSLVDTALQLPYPNTVPAGTTETLNLYIRLAANSTGTVWLDDISVKVVEDPIFKVVVPYNGIITDAMIAESQSIPIRFYAQKNDTTDTYDITELKMLAVLKKGVDVIASGLSPALTDNAEYFTYSLSTVGVAHDDYTLECSLVLASDGTTIINYAVGGTPCTITKNIYYGSASGVAGDVYIDEYNRFLVNGAPFFPIIAWLNSAEAGWSDSYAAKFLALAALGFNTVMDYYFHYTYTGDTLASLANKQLRIDAAESAGLKIIPAINTAYNSFVGTTSDLTDYDDGTVDWNTAADVIAGHVNQFKAESSVIGWLIGDDFGNKLTEVDDIYAAIKANDLNHPVFCGFIYRCVSHSFPYLDYYDVSGLNFYPIYSHNSNSSMAVNSSYDIRWENFYRTHYKINKWNLDNKPEFAVLEAYSNPTLAEYDYSTAPSFKEYMYEAVCAIMAGAKAITWYPLYYVSDAELPVLGEAVTAVKDYISKFALGTTSDLTVAADDSSKVEVHITKADDTTYYILTSCKVRSHRFTGYVATSRLITSNANHGLTTGDKVKFSRTIINNTTEATIIDKDIEYSVIVNNATTFTINDGGTDIPIPEATKYIDWELVSYTETSSTITVTGATNQFNVTKIWDSEDGEVIEAMNPGLAVAFSDDFPDLGTKLYKLELIVPEGETTGLHWNTSSDARTADVAFSRNFMESPRKNQVNIYNGTDKTISVVFNVLDGETVIPVKTVSVTTLTGRSVPIKGLFTSGTLRIIATPAAACTGDLTVNIY